MAIETSAAGTVYTGDDVYRFHYMRVAMALRMDARPNGIPFSSRGSIRQTAMQICGSVKGTKLGVLKDYAAWLDHVIPGNSFDATDGGKIKLPSAPADYVVDGKNYRRTNGGTVKAV